MKTVFMKLWIAFLVAIVLLVYFMAGQVTIKVALAAGETTSEYTSDLGDYWGSAYEEEWIDAANSPQSHTSTTSEVGWSSNADKDWRVKASAVGFDISAIPAGSTILSATVLLRCDAKANTGSWSEQYYALYTMDEPVHNSAGLLTIDYTRLSSVERYSDWGAGDWVQFDLMLPGWQEWIDSPKADGRIWFYIATTNHGLLYEPDPKETTKEMYMRFYAQGTGSAPKISITYLAPPAERITAIDIPENEATTTSLPTGNITDVSWITPRSAYADEAIGFDISGDAGTPIDCSLKDKDGNALFETTDSVRTNGHYYFTASVETDTSNFARCVVTQSSTTVITNSYWGYIAPSPGATMEINTTSCYDTDLTHYDYEISTFVLSPQELMKVHWYTNIDGSSELADYDLEIHHQGYSTDAIFSENLSYLKDNYWLNTDNNSDVLHIRFMLFCMDGSVSGFNDYDGMIYSLNQTMSGDTYGFYVPTVLDGDTSEELTTPYDAYWYVPKPSDAVLMSMVHTEYPDGGYPSVDISSGALGGVLSDLNLVELKVIPNIGDTATVADDSLYTTPQRIESEYEYVTSGNYVLRVELHQGQCSFRYIRDMSFIVGETEDEPGTGEQVIKNFQDWIEEFLYRFGLNNDMGHWIVIIFAMACLFLATYKSPVIRVVLPLMVLGVAIVAKWLDIWIIVLLAMGAGLTIWGILRRRMSGGGGSASDES